MAAQVCGDSGLKSWRTPATTSHHGPTECPYNSCSSASSVTPLVRSPSERNQTRLISPPTQPEASQARVLPSSARSEEHTSELQSLLRISYAVFCLKKNNNQSTKLNTH